MGAVTARQRESIPAGTGTTDLPRETVHEGRQRHGWKERERGEGGDEEGEREGGGGGNLRPGEKAGREGGEGKASSIKRGARGGGGGE